MTLHSYHNFADHFVRYSTMIDGVTYSVVLPEDDLLEKGTEWANNWAKEQLAKKHKNAILRSAS